MARKQTAFAKTLMLPPVVFAIQHGWRSLAGNKYTRTEFWFVRKNVHLKVTWAKGYCTFTVSEMCKSPHATPLNNAAIAMLRRAVRGQEIA